MSDAPPAPAKAGFAQWQTPILLFVLTSLSMLLTGALMHHSDELRRMELGPMDAVVWTLRTGAILDGWDFLVSLMGILLAHEFGHYFAGRYHRIDVSPPYFIPMPIISMLGTMGAVIRIRSPISRRNALLDVGAAGPIAGFCVALPVLIYGLATSPVQAIPADDYAIEGRGLLYLGVLWLLKGSIPEGRDVFLNPVAMAGWGGLLVTQINLLPIGQLDGGHVAYALFGKRQDTYSRRLHFALPFVALIVSAAYTIPAWMAGQRTLDELGGELQAGLPWLVWAIVIRVLMRFGGTEHPPVEDEPLTRGRRVVAVLTLILFVLLVMPSWMYQP